MSVVRGAGAEKSSMRLTKNSINSRMLWWHDEVDDVLKLT